jgi:hypothetical protein
MVAEVAVEPLEYLDSKERIAYLDLVLAVVQGVLMAGMCLF